MPVAPPVVSVDLAEAALANPALIRARGLAGWVGSGRQLTARGVPRPAEAVEACRVLGIALPSSRLRSALDVEELMQAWIVALDAGLVFMDGRWAWSVPEAMATDPRTVLDTWIRAAAGGLGLPDEPCRGCLTVLHELHMADRALAIGELADALSVAEPTGPCPDCGDIHAPGDPFGLLGFGGLYAGDVLAAGPLEHLEEALGSLVFYRAGAIADGAVRLTALGSMLASALFEGCAPASDADAAALLAVVAELPPPIAGTMARPWFDARSADAAVRELLSFAASATGQQRAASLGLARTRGPAAMAAWREQADQPGFGAYARSWLADQGEAVEEQPADEAWLGVDLLAMTLDTLSETLPPEWFSAIVQQLGGGNGMREMLTGSGHPAAAGILAMLPVVQITILPPPPLLPASGWLPAPAESQEEESSGLRGGAGPDDVYRLKISLREVSKPAVWRRVLVPAAITLGDLSEVILRCMGWRGGHLHVFEAGDEQFGPVDDDLGFIDETDVPLSELLDTAGDWLLYTYDFGDSWEHDVVLEDILPAAPGRVLPSCVTGKGACPPEDCGGAWAYADLKEILADPSHAEYPDMRDWVARCSDGPFDPKAFSVGTVNARLSHLTLHL